MKPVYEFLLACMLVLVAGCSAIAGIFNAGLWAGVFVISSIVGLILLLTVKARK